MEIGLEISDLLIPSHLLPGICWVDERGGEKIQSYTSWWLKQPVSKICSSKYSKWTIFPNFRGEQVNIKLFETTPIYPLTFEGDPFM